MLYDKRWDKLEAAVELEPWRQLLLEAADVIEQRGWCRHTRMNSRGEVCAVGAILSARWGFDRLDWGSWYDDEPTREAVLNLRARVASGTISGVGGWNDTPDRTKDEVVAMLRDVAQKD